MDLNDQQSWATILGAVVASALQWQLINRNKKEKDLREKEENLREEVQQHRDELIALRLKSVDESGVRRITEEMVKPLKEGQDDIRKDVKSLLKEIHSLSLSLAEQSRRK